MALPRAADHLQVMFEGLLAADIETSDRDEVAALVADAQRVRNWLDAFDTRCIRRNRALCPEPTDRGVRQRDRDLLTGAGRRGSSEARAAAGRADTCEQIPQLGEALGKGTANSGHLDAYAKATAGLDDATRARLAEHGNELADAAGEQSVDEFERTVRDKARELSNDDGAAVLERQRAQRRCGRGRDPDTGLGKTTLVLDPLADERVWNVIHHAIRTAQAQRQDDDPRTWEQFVADVVVDLLCGTTGVVTGLPEICVVVDLTTMLTGTHADTLCETSDGHHVPVDTLRRLCCDAHIVALALNVDNVELNLGRTVRTANRNQRRALRALYRICAWHGCAVKFDQCRLHHLTFWTSGGLTDIDNLLPLCQHHHHLVHEGGWSLTMTADRVITIHTPLHTLHYRGLTATRCRHSGAGAADVPASTTYPARPDPPLPPPRPPTSPETDTSLDAPQLLGPLNEPDPPESPADPPSERRARSPGMQAVFDVVEAIAARARQRAEQDRHRCSA